MMLTQLLNLNTSLKKQILINYKLLFNKIIPLKKLQIHNSDLTIVIKASDLLNVMLYLKNHMLCQFKILTCISAVDYPLKKFRFMLIYELLSLRFNVRLKVKIFAFELLSISSVSSLYLSASWYEAEIWDLFGVFFKHHPNLKRILTDYGFEGNALRKDFPLSGFIEFRYSEVKKRIIKELLEFSQEYRTFSFLSPWAA